MNVLDQYVGCSDCMHECCVRDALDACFASWPNHSWVAFHCLNCDGVNRLEVRNGAIAEGYLDGAPAPCFIIKRRVRLDDFHIKAANNGISVRTLNLRWFIPQLSGGK